MIKLILILFLLPISLYAQIDLSQDDPNIKWHKIENSNFKIVFPDFAENSAQYVLNLLEHYKPIVDKTYAQNSEKLTVVLRANVAEPNGFVTLAPRRSEWFLNQSSTPLVGSSDWLQTLAIHEYRHVTQFDFLNRSNNKLAYYLGGEELVGTLLVITMPGWFFEGDAVWTETKYSDAGRGRSPRFSNRFKALILSDQAPSLDEFLAGDFTRPLPDIYVYGYFLITKGINDYGPQFWQQVAARASDDSLNPYALYRSFREITGKSIEQFYDEMLSDLETTWKKNYGISKIKKDYTDYASPIVDEGKLYFIKKDVKNFWQFYERNLKSGKVKYISELAITPSLHKLDIKKGHLLYIQNLSDYRYGYRTYSDIFTVNLKTNVQQQLTQNKKYTHPKFNNEGNEFLAINRTKSNNWNIDLFNKKGVILRTIKGTKDRQYVEAIWGDKKDLYAIALDRSGQKRIVRIDLQFSNNNIIDLTLPSRNNIYYLSYDQNQLYFEADDQGVINIFSINTETRVQSRCSDAAIAASFPYVENGHMFYSATTGFGSELRENTVTCTPVASDFLEKPSEYLGEGPSDNYLKSEPIDFDQFKELQTKKADIFEYSEYKSALIPHSWSVLSGRGTQVSATSTNILNSLDLLAAVGLEAEENANYGSFALSYRKHYPIFNFGIRLSERENDIVDDDGNKKETIRWNENRYNTSISLPYIFQKNLYRGYHLLTGFAEHITIGDTEGRIDYGLQNENLNGLGFIYQLSYKKTQLLSQLNPEYGFDMTLLYEDVAAKENSNLDSYIGSASMNIFLPGLKKLHSTHLGLKSEYRPENELAYKIQDKYFPVIGYTFSRGYTYEYTPKFNKLEFDYSAPIFYPNYDLWNLAFLKRINGNFYFDHTKVNLNGSDINLNSTGFELEFDTVLLRKFPLSFGLRYIERLRHGDKIGEFFINI